MTGANIKRYRNSLQAMATRLGGTVAGLIDQVSTPTGGEAAGGLSNAPVHLADVGSEAYNQELGATLLENESYLSDEVAAALDRLDRGVFGTCEGCGKGIVPERLDALPYARHCVACATRVQSGRLVNLNDGRPTGWLGASGHEGLSLKGDRVVGQELGSASDDVHAAGTPGGGTAVGGLAGTNIGGGAPDRVNLEQSAGGPEMEPLDEAGEEEVEAYSGTSGGAVGGSPANKRARGGSGKRSGGTGNSTMPRKNPKTKTP